MDYTAKIAPLDSKLSHLFHQALTAGKEELFTILGDPFMEVLATALKNPSFDMSHLLVLLKRRDLSEDLLKAICRQKRFGESHEFLIALARQPNLPAAQLANLLPRLYLFDLAALCYAPGVTPDQKFAAERAIIQRLPTTPLGNKLTLARRGTAAITEVLIREGDPRLIGACLDSPHLKESAVFGFLNSAHATAETISMVARHPRWKLRPNLRLAILKNHRTPDIWFTMFLPNLPLSDVKGLLSSPRMSGSHKMLVEAELKRRGLTAR
jgi:hypothetical protein